MRKKSLVTLALTLAVFAMIFSFWQALSPAHAASSTGSYKQSPRRILLLEVPRLLLAVTVLVAIK